MDIVRIPSYDGTAEEYRYPRAGDQNASSCLKLVSFNYDRVTSSIFNEESMFPSVTLPDLRSVSPDLEYLVRAGWFDDDVYWVQTLNRRQNQLDLAAFSLRSSFPPQIILQEISPDLWINVGDLLHFVKRKQEPLSVGSTIHFIWTSEESGFRHLYTVSAELSGNEQERGVTPPDDKMECMSGTEVAMAKKVQKRALTCGNWEVSDRDVWVHEDAQVVYFIALKEIPLERHLYVAPLDPAQRSVNPIKRLTESGFSHTYIAFDPSHQYFVNIQSNVSVPPFGYCYRVRTVFIHSLLLHLPSHVSLLPLIPCLLSR